MGWSSAMAGGDVTVRADWLARRLEQEQHDAAEREQHQIMVTTHRVSRVPDHVRYANRDAYRPGLVAIGPIHAGDTERRLRPGSRLKMAYLHSLISRGEPDETKHLAVIQGYIRVVAAREWEARATYPAEDVDSIIAEDFIEMLVVDGCFIIEHLVNVYTGKDEPSLHATPFGPTQLSVDLVLAENQIPFFVLAELINHTKLPEFDSVGYAPPVVLMKLLLYYLAGEKGRDMSEWLPGAGGISHILHLLHCMVRERIRWEPPPGIQYAASLGMAEKVARQLQRIPQMLLVPLLYPTLPEECRWGARYGPVDVPSASDLKRMRVRFKMPHRGSMHKKAFGIVSLMGPVPLAVKLVHEELLQLPQFYLYQRTAPLLLNLMAFEQSFVERAGDVSAYVWFMAKIVQSAEDAGMLATAAVLQGCDDREEVLRFFRQLGAACDAAEEVEKSYLGTMLEKLWERTRHPHYTKWADVQRYYFTVPWSVVAALLTVVTTVTTILQTYASFKQKP